MKDGKHTVVYIVARVATDLPMEEDEVAGKYAVPIMCKDVAPVKYKARAEQMNVVRLIAHDTWVAQMRGDPLQKDVRVILREIAEIDPQEIWYGSLVPLPDYEEVD